MVRRRPVIRRGWLDKGATVADLNEDEILTIDIDGKPTVVLTAKIWKRIERAGRDWFQADLSFYSWGASRLRTERRLCVPDHPRNPKF